MFSSRSGQTHAIVISDTNGKLCVGSYHMWRLLSNPDNYLLDIFRAVAQTTDGCSDLTLHFQGTNDWYSMFKNLGLVFLMYLGKK